MMIGSFAERKHLLKDTYQNYTCDASRGLDKTAIEEECKRLEREMRDVPMLVKKAKLIEFVYPNVRLSINPNELFADKFDFGNAIQDIMWDCVRAYDRTQMKELLESLQNGLESYAFTVGCDFGHNCSDWSLLFEKGLTGMIREAENYLQKPELSERQMMFYESVKTAYGAVRKLVLNFADLAGKMLRVDPDNGNLQLMSQSLRNIADNPPANIHEALQLQLIVYTVISSADGNSQRTLGMFDRIYYPFYRHDIETGTFAEDEIREIIRYYFYHFYAKKVGSNIPLYICGRKPDGSDDTNEFTYLIVEEYIGLDINDPKFQVCFRKDIPDRLLRMILESIRNGRNSFVFMNDEKIVEALIKSGAEPKDAENYAVVGCYETLCAGKEVACTCAGRINLEKAIEAAFTNGYDMLTGKKIGIETGSPDELDTYDKFYEAVKRQIRYFSDCAISLINAYEKGFSEMNTTPLFSAILHNCMENERDAYDCGAKYNNTSINIQSIATAADSLAAVKKAVFEDKILTLRGFSDILKRNWEGAEKLRAEILRKYPKYGNNDPYADEIACSLSEYAASCINGRKNERGGIYRVGMFTIDWCFVHGKAAAAGPDGRKRGEPLSKNMCAVTAMDKRGATALIHSAVKIDYSMLPNGTVLDLMLHKSAAAGSDGIDSMAALVKTFMKEGGFAIQINVFDPKILREAQQTPEKYSTLQVRKCGWNVYFVDLNKEEQDEFIKQAESLA